MSTRQRCLFLVCVLFLFICIMQVGCSVPRLVWPQKNIQSYDLGAASLEKRLLIASRSSEFKDAIVHRIREAFKDEPVYIKFIGLDQLKQENGREYSAVVLINTCIAWGMDRHVEAFLKRHKDQGYLIVLTTSGDGGWLPDMGGRNFDAISCASEKTNLVVVTEKIITKIRLLVQKR